MFEIFIRLGFVEFLNHVRDPNFLVDHCPVQYDLNKDIDLSMISIDQCENETTFSEKVFEKAQSAVLIEVIQTNYLEMIPKISHWSSAYQQAMVNMNLVD